MKKKTKKKKAAETPLYWVELEFPTGNRTKVFRYYQISDGMLQKEQAEALADKLRVGGVGGRILRFDGTKNGSVERVWGSAARVAVAEQIEKEALTR